MYVARKRYAQGDAEVLESRPYKHPVTVLTETTVRASALRWELESRRRTGFHGFLMLVSAIVFMLAHATAGSVAMFVELFAGVTALYGAFINANLLRWGVTGRPLGEVEEELEQITAERRTLALPPGKGDRED